MSTRTCTLVSAALGLGLVSAVIAVSGAATAPQMLVPGTGQKVAFDDFEDAAWEYVPNGPKSSNDIDKQDRLPVGESKNGKWYESPFRGQPDSVRRVATPAGGLAGSTGALAMRTLFSGLPGRPSGKMHQDDLIMAGADQLGSEIPVAWMPSAVVRVYVPSFDRFDTYDQASFGFRANLRTYVNKRGLLTGGRKLEPYWPGIWIYAHSTSDGEKVKRGAILQIRANDYGQDFHGPEIAGPGWWTLGMSFTPDGRVHYFAKAGVEDLTAADHLGSFNPYGFRADHLTTIFFNVVNQDDGRTWSTEWIIDDPALYVLRTQ